MQKREKEKTNANKQDNQTDVHIGLREVGQIAERPTNNLYVSSQVLLRNEKASKLHQF